MIGDATGIASPLASGVNRLKKSDAPRRVLVLFTDGRNTAENRLTPEQAAALAQELEQAKEKAADLKSSAVAVQKEYDKIMSWADLYAGSSIEGKKMILRQLIERVNIGRNFEIEVEFKISVTQFFDFLHPEGDKSVYYRAS